MANRITTLFSFKEEGSGLKKIKADIQDADGAVGKLKAGWKGATTEFKNSGAAQAAVGAAALKIAHESIQAASALEESANAVSTTFERSTGDINALADESVDKYGMSERAFNELAVAFSGFASQIASGGGDVAETVDMMATRVADFASVHNLSMEDAATKFQSALAGETEAMRRYGIDVSAAAVEQYALKNGLIASKSEMTEAIKVQARYGLLMQETDQWAGDFAKTQGSLANQTKTAQANIENLSASLGKALIPAATEAVGALNDLVDAAEASGLSLSDALDIDKATKSAISGGKGLGAVTEGMKSLNTALGWVGLGGKDAADGLDEFAAGAGRATGATRGLGGAAAKAAELIGLTTEELQALKDAADPTWNEYLEDQARLNAMMDGAPGSFEEMAAAASGAADNIEDLGDEADSTAKRIEDITEAFSELNDELSDRDAWLDVEDAADDFEDAIKAAEEATKEFGAESREAEQANRNMERSLMDRIRSIQAYVTETENIPDEVVTEVAALLDQGSVDAAEAILRDLERHRSTVVNITTRLNTAAGSNFAGPDASTSTRQSGSTKKYGATGGIVNQRTDNITLGESGPEVVIPLDRSPGNEPLSNLKGGSGSGVAIHIGNIATQARNGQELLDEFTAALRRQGPSAIRRALGMDV